jgi:hypothetical protein
MITVNDANDRVIGIYELRGDPEAAHADEDTLWEEVLTAISNGADNAPGLARAALRTKGIDFPRWGA